MNTHYCTIEIADSDAIVQLRLAIEARVTMLDDMLAANSNWPHGVAMLAASRAALAAIDRRVHPA